MYTTLAIILLVTAIAGWIWYTGKSIAEDNVNAEAAKAEAAQAQEARTRLEEQRSRDNETARQKDVREASAAVRDHRVGEFLRDSLQDDPSAN